MPLVFSFVFTTAPHKHCVCFFFFLPRHGVLHKHRPLHLLSSCLRSLLLSSQLCTAQPPSWRSATYQSTGGQTSRRRAHSSRTSCVGVVRSSRSRSGSRSVRRTSRRGVASATAAMARQVPRWARPQTVMMRARILRVRWVALMLCRKEVNAY